MTGARLSRKEKQQQTRAAIIDAATTQFAKFGVEGTSMEAIARHAGLTQGAIYSNFASKADLWWAIGEQMSRTLDLTELLGDEQSLGDELASVGRAVWQLLRAASRTELLLTQEFDLFLMRRPRERAKYAREARGDRLDLAALLDSAAAARGEPLPMDAELLAKAIEVVGYGLLHTFMLDPRAVDEELCVAAFTALAGVPNQAAAGRPSSARNSRTTFPPSTFTTSCSAKPRRSRAAVTNGSPRGPSSPGMQLRTSIPSMM